MTANVFDFNARIRRAEQPIGHAGLGGMIFQQSSTPGLHSAFKKIETWDIDRFGEYYRAYKEEEKTPQQETVFTALSEVPIKQVTDLAVASHFAKKFFIEIANATSDVQGTPPDDQVKTFLNDLQALFLSIKIELSAGTTRLGSVYVQASFAREGHVLSVIYGDNGEMYARPVSVTICYDDPAQ